MCTKLSPRSRSALVVLLLSSTALGAGCNRSSARRERFGKTYYLDGSGNLGFGTSDVRVGLYRAGYKGDCEIFNWSHTLSPVLDQINILGARAEARRLARSIEEYKDRHPDRAVNAIGLSAGTGIIAWALEYLKPGYEVDNVFFLGSSLSARYDVRKMLKSVRGKVYVYYSPKDQILAAVQIFGIGTIDRKWATKAAGQVGLRGRRGKRYQKIVNYGWSPKWRRMGWDGGHTDCVRRRFVQFEIGPKIIGYIPGTNSGPDEEPDPNTPPDEDTPVEASPEAAPPQKS